jgi:hypothetical protein
MNLFSKPSVKEIELQNHFSFMYENFIISSQNKLYLLLEEENGLINALCFDFSLYKFGHPNDEIVHPLMKYGLGIYGFFEVNNSDWIKELKKLNSQHPRHNDNLYAEHRHYIAKFKDTTLEVIARKYELLQINSEQLQEIINREISFLKKDIP